MDTMRRKMEKAERVGRELVRALIPEGDLYIKLLLAKVGEDRQVLFKLQNELLVPQEPYWAKIDRRLLLVCNNLIVGALYGALHLSESLPPMTHERIRKYLELEFFNKLDAVEVRS